MTESGLDAVIHRFENTSGIRDLEQAAEHLAANALYRLRWTVCPQWNLTGRRWKFCWEKTEFGME